MNLAGQLRASLERSRHREHETTIFYSDMRDTEFPAEEPGVDAAVLIPVVARPQPTVLLTLRNADMSSHAGQVAFPGGKVDPDDDGPVSTALREAEEEIDLKPRHVEIVGTTDLYRTGTGFHITPVIGVIPPDLPLAPHEAEVAAIFEVPFDVLFTPANFSENSLEWQGRMRHFFEMYWEEQRIWGATAAMIVNLGQRFELGRLELGR
jgi:8-oxo-dGTP pyrophosphatase MutT (NUDIX family)